MTAAASPILLVSELVAGYGEVDVLRGVSIEVAQGSLVSVIGPNGAGKSTLLKAIYGLATTRSGTVRLTVDGASHDITGQRPDRVTALGVGLVPQLDNVFSNMSVTENLEMGAFARPWRLRESTVRVFEMFPRLADRRRQRAGTLSGGERAMLALARALMPDPRVLLLDEPSAGLAPMVVELVFEKIREINASGVTIVMVEQNARRSLEMSDYAYVLDTGVNRFEGPGSQILDDPTVTDLYLGGRGRLEGPDPPG